MPQVSVAARATGLGSRHAVALVGVVDHRGLVHWLPEARPAGAGLKLGLRTEERLPAAHAGIGTGVLGLPVFSGKRRLRSRLASDVILLWRQLLLPLCFRFADFFCHDFLRVSRLLDAPAHKSSRQ